MVRAALAPGEPPPRGHHAPARRRVPRVRRHALGQGFAVFQGTSNGGRQVLRNRRSNRHIVPLYGKSDCLFTHFAHR